jgi:FkbM family methyltransferase
MASLTSFYSQNFEDVLLSRVFSDVTEGIYVDVGCHHELQDSVTRYFYEHGWSGINLDPVAEHIQEYALRPRDISLNLAAGASASRLPFSVVDGSGLSSFYASHVECAHTHGLRQVEERWVEVQTLNAILEEHLAPGRAITFLKIDVEGHEYDVLKGIDLRRYRPIVILVETTQPCSTLLVESFSDISAYICGHGYSEVYFDGVNTWWLAEEQKNSRLHHFQYPIGVFDGYGPFEIRRVLLEAEQGQREAVQARIAAEQARDEALQALNNSPWRRLTHRFTRRFTG